MRWTARTAALVMTVWLADSGTGRLQEDPVSPEIRVHERKAPWGTVLEKYHFYEKNGKRIKHGESFSNYDDGKPFTREEYRHGEFHGLLQSFREGRGDLASERRYAEGEQHGVERHYDLDGAILFQGTWKNGKAWEGRFWRGGGSATGQVECTDTTKTIQFKGGRKVPGSKKKFSVTYRLEDPKDLPDPSRYLRWNWISYEIDSEYPFLDQLPPFEKIPFLIDWCTNRDDAISTAKSQLVALTRCDFGEWGGSRISKEDRPAWLDWWEQVGKRILRDRETLGVRDPAAWKLVAGDRPVPVPVPKAPILLPETYSLITEYQGGDYQGVTREEMTLERSADGARLVRTFSTRTSGPRITEEWLPFTIEDADRTARVVAYAIDHPWFLNDEEAINEAFWKEIDGEKKKEKKAEDFGSGFGKIRGRESMSTYYGGSKIRLEDGDGNVWWNDDPKYWDGGNPDRFNWAAQIPGETVYPMLAERFPESQRLKKGESAGWKQIRIENVEPPSGNSALQK